MFKQIVLIAALLVGIQSAYSQKVAFIDSQELASIMPDIKSANSILEDYKGMLSKKGEEMVTSLQQKYQQLQTKQQSGQIAPIELEKEGKTLQEDEAKIKAFEADSQQKIYDKTQELLKPIQDKVNLAIDEVAKEQGVTYVFDASIGMILYADPATDLMPLVKAKLGLQ